MTAQFIVDLGAAIAQRTTDEWITSFEQAGVPAGRYRTVDELVDDPQVRANNLAADLCHDEVGALTMVGPVVSMSGTPTAARTASPTVGQDNEAVLAEVGYSSAEIAQLIERGVLSRR